MLLPDLRFMRLHLLKNRYISEERNLFQLFANLSFIFEYECSVHTYAQLYCKIVSNDIHMFS